ncbi:YybH family protein [Gemmatimonadota bacterium]
MRVSVPRIVTVAFVVCIPCTALAQGSGDEDAINRLIDQYSQLEDARDMTAQAALMTPDRIWIAQALGRITNQAQNMRIQQAGFDVQNELLPGVQWFTDARDRIIRFYGRGDVAVASFYWYSSFVLPANATDEQAENAVQPQPRVITMVLEKQGGNWKIVHTHNSALGPPVGQ